mmetsp:Transcript_9996/g.34835  ORF Transcript_9996/g.34835 Transcript_9996/m.34835 type:complete len:80 (+) Transcript_9996:2684-2923(+)
MPLGFKRLFENSWNTCNKSERGNVFGHNSPSSHYSTTSNCHSWAYNGSCTNPSMIFNSDSITVRLGTSTIQVNWVRPDT